MQKLILTQIVVVFFLPLLGQRSYLSFWENTHWWSSDRKQSVSSADISPQLIWMFVFFILKQMNQTYPQETLQAFDSCHICHRIQTYPAYAWRPAIVKLWNRLDRFCTFKDDIWEGFFFFTLELHLSHLNCTKAWRVGFFFKLLLLLIPFRIPWEEGGEIGQRHTDH